jgi:hypothetical protein
MVMSSPVDFEIPEDSVPDISPNSSDKHGTCTVCGAPTYRAGTRGRFPGKCDLHKSTKSASRSGVARTSGKNIAEGVTSMHDTIGLLVAMKDPELATLIIGPKRLEAMMAEEQTDLSISVAAGKAWGKVAKNHDAVNKTLERMTTTSDWAEVFTAYLPLLMLTAQRQPKLPLFTKLRVWRAARKAKRDAS